MKLCIVTCSVLHVASSVEALVALWIRIWIVTDLNLLVAFRHSLFVRKILPTLKMTADTRTSVQVIVAIGLQKGARPRPAILACRSFTNSVQL